MPIAPGLCTPCSLRPARIPAGTSGQHIAFADKRRAVCFTEKNAVSSRSHAVLVVTVDVNLPPNYNTGMGAKHTTARMNLVDLAGAEKVEKTGAKGQQLKEGIAINQSLSALAKVR